MNHKLLLIPLLLSVIPIQAELTPEDEQILNHVQHVVQCYTWSLGKSKLIEKAIQDSRIYNVEKAMQTVEQALIRFMKENNCEQEYLEFFQKFWKNLNDKELRKTENQPQHKYVKLADANIAILQKKYGNQEISQHLLNMKL